MVLPKLVTPDLAPKSTFIVDTNGEMFILGGAAGGYGIIPKPEYNPLYLAGLLNSRLLSFFITSSGQQMESGYYSFEARFIRSAPIYPVTHFDGSTLTCRNQIGELVNRILSTNIKVISARTSQEKTFIQRQIDATNTQIDRLVYDLYGLSNDEIAVVEAATAK